VTRALHVVVLCAFAVAQPLFELLERNVPHLRSLGLDAVDLAAVAVVLVVAVPGALLLVKAGLERIWPRAAGGIHLGVVAALATAIAMTVLEELDAGETPGWVLAPGAVAGGALGAYLYARARFAPVLLTVLSPALLALPLLFLFDSPVRALISPPAELAAASNVPVVVVVFDGLPLSSLLGDAEHIDRGWFPHFAALADEAHFFRNATTVAETTVYALPAIATGLYPAWIRPATTAEYPQNLFTLLSETHAINVFEPYTWLCPLDLCYGGRVRILRSERLARVLANLPFLYLQVVLPDDWARRVTAINATWREIESPDTNGEAWRQQLRTHRSDLNWMFSEFLARVVASDRPALHFLHVSLLDGPPRYLPSGRSYHPTGAHPSARPRSADPRDNSWAETQALQRHLLQVAFADAFLGRLRSQLEAEGLYERALVIVTADHGVNFTPGLRNHTLDPRGRNAGDLLWVPLLVKLPAQTAGRVSDRNVETIDVLPTILDVLGKGPPQPLDGQSLMDAASPERSEKVVYRTPVGGEPLQRERRSFPASVPGALTTVATISRSFQREAGPEALFSLGPYRALAGRRTSDISDPDTPAVGAIHLDDPAAYEDVDPESGLLPALVSGTLEMDEPPAESLFLAIAVNGAIRATPRTFRSTDGALRFSAVVPEASFRAGANDLEIFVLERIPRGVALLRTEIRPPPPAPASPDPNSALEDSPHSGRARHDDAGGLLALDLPGLFDQPLDGLLDRRGKLLHRLGE
jgi:hypothetical protein